VTEPEIQETAACQMRYPGQHDDGKDDQNKPCKEHDEARDCVPGYAPSKLG